MNKSNWFTLLEQMVQCRPLLSLEVLYHTNKVIIDSNSLSRAISNIPDQTLMGGLTNTITSSISDPVDYTYTLKNIRILDGAVVGDLTEYNSNIEEIINNTKDYRMSLIYFHTPHIINIPKQYELRIIEKIVKVHIVSQYTHLA